MEVRTTEWPGLIGMGYEGQDIDAFVERAVQADVALIADVRLTPVSRKRGFSKNALATVLRSAGIEYLHFPELGNPKVNRAGFVGTSSESRAARARYGRILRSESASAAIDHLAILARDRRVAVLCFEADEARCHRELVLLAVRRRLGL